MQSLLLASSWSRLSIRFKCKSPSQSPMAAGCLGNNWLRLLHTRSWPLHLCQKYDAYYISLQPYNWFVGTTTTIYRVQVADLPLLRTKRCMGHNHQHHNPRGGDALIDRVV